MCTCITDASKLEIYYSDLNKKNTLLSVQAKCIYMCISKIHFTCRPQKNMEIEPTILLFLTVGYLLKYEHSRRMAASSIHIHNDGL